MQGSYLSFASGLFSLFQRASLSAKNSLPGVQKDCKLPENTCNLAPGCRRLHTKKLQRPGKHLQLAFSCPAFAQLSLQLP
jgi:hypothetical protein